MNIQKIITGLTFSLVFVSRVAVSADFDKGLEAFGLGDFNTVLAEWTPLAEQGNSTAQNNLGNMYADGRGVLENDKTAVKWYTLAAEQDHAKAKFNMRLCMIMAMVFSQTIDVTMCGRT